MKLAWLPILFLGCVTHNQGLPPGYSWVNDKTGLHECHCVRTYQGKVLVFETQFEALHGSRRFHNINL